MEQAPAYHWCIGEVESQYNLQTHWKTGRGPLFNVTLKSHWQHILKNEVKKYQLVQADHCTWLEIYLSRYLLRLNFRALCDSTFPVHNPIETITYV